MTSFYPACFYKESVGYSVLFPDLSGLSAYGKNENDAYAKATDTLAKHLFIAKKAGEKLPAPSAIKDISIKKTAKKFEIDAEPAYVTMVSVDADEYAKEHFERTVRKTLTLPLWLYDAAVEQKINCSKVLADALTAEVLKRR